MTSRGFGETEFRQVARWIVETLTHPDDAEHKARIKAEVTALTAQFPSPQYHNGA